MHWMYSFGVELPFFLAHLIISGTVVYQYPETLTVTEGTNVTFQCDISEMLGECTYIVWMQLGPTKKLTLWPQETYSIHTRRTICLLNILNADKRSEGTFYCAMLNGAMFILGNGSVLTISETLNPYPYLEVLVPVDWHGGPSSLVPLLCLVSGIDPSQARVYWEVEGNFQSSERLPEIWSEKPASVRVQLLVPSHTWAEGSEVTCFLESNHGVKMNKTVRRTEMTSRPLVFLALSLASVCILLSMVLIIITLYVFKLRQKPRIKKLYPCEYNKDRSEGLTEVQYASLKFGARRQRPLPEPPANTC
ncbi:hypothetical protein DPEC_G00220570 [Dallia pectoralis]|uniref:Uncharacterized protein n=1 Tax=Dallia pectoralis TaxID=75939 RepID=A0ACC2G3V0_DALPE|nr:hypothetical protein DPEC_G00220570 [Dallia pectoralis]